MAPVNLTDRELEILVAYVKLSKGEVDWTAVAQEANCTTAKYARDKFALIKNKLVAAGNGEGGGGGGTPKKVDTPNPKAAKDKATPGTKTPKKRKNADGDDEETSAKKPRGKAFKAKANTPIKEDGDEANDSAAIKEEPNEAGEMMDALSA